MKLRYRQRLALPLDTPKDSHLRALERAHELRKFEIENYWRRSTYFWGFQLVAFTALALSRTDGEFDPLVVIAIAMLGTLAATTAILSARGSKFWQENWEMHVDLLEDEVEGLLHKTALVKRNLSYSVSRVNERFLQIIAVGWVVIFIIAAADLLSLDWPVVRYALEPRYQVGGVAAAIGVGIVWLTWRTKSQLRGRAFRQCDMAGWHSAEPSPRWQSFRRSLHTHRENDAGKPGQTHAVDD
ncbi:hypothetical protein [Alteriqipengyuania lutimaris]|uniref:RipA family octameric membrane protein n=1 Tax=Alteriqipengyuania lutimaris TaxID=1538146 RepID=UPI001CFC9F74|nr:hypothetical protein [Alteriqipengyuania lutimaris]